MDDLSFIEIIYWVATILGGTLFLLRSILMLVGGGLSDEALDTALDSGLDAVDGNQAGFQLLSLQGLTAFFMMFGLVGLTLLKAGQPVLLTMLGGIIAGLLTVWLTGLLFLQMKRLQSEGNLDLQNAIGAKGSVYLTIPAGSSGQIEIAVQGSLRILDAVSENRKKIATGEKIHVVGVADPNTLIVEKIS